MILAALQAAGWLAGTVLLWRWPTPPAGAAGESGAAGAIGVSVVVPARNEAERLPGLLASLRAQVRRPVEVVVVDDGSDDGTAEVAAHSGARVVRTNGPPPGWTGKTWASHQGVKMARGDVIVLLDADTWLAPDALGRLVAAHRDVPAGLLSVQPFHVTGSAVEQLSAVCNVVSVLGSGAAAAWSPPSSATVAFGPCLVTTPEALRAAGGFEAVRDDVVEDIGLARAYRVAGRDVRCMGGGDVVCFRMYAGLRPLVEGWTKNLAAGAGRAPAVPGIGASAWVAGAAAAAVAVLTAPGAASAAVYLAFAAQLAWMLRRLGRFQWWVAPLYPVPLFAFVALFAVSVALRTVVGRARWRGRAVAVRHR